MFLCSGMQMQSGRQKVGSISLGLLTDIKGGIHSKRMLAYMSSSVSFDAHAPSHFFL